MGYLRVVRQSVCMNISPSFMSFGYFFMI